MYNKPFVILRKKGNNYLEYFSGTQKTYELIEEIDESLEQVFITPFSQAKEKGYEINDSGEKISSIIIEEKRNLNLEEFFDSFEYKNIKLEQDFEEYFSRKDYENLVQNIIKNEIGNGEGANFLIAQKLSGKIFLDSVNTILSAFKNLISGDYGYYMQFVFFDGERFLLGSSPEKNVLINPHPNPLPKVEGIAQKVVRMNPISGTFRKKRYENFLELKKDFLPFLKDEKEINELFMSVDEELKMMSKICSSGGIIVGPILKEMAHVIHTEYLLSGYSEKKLLDIFRESMWACTVIGSPLESAFRVAKKYEKFSRKYYSGAITHLQKDSLDSAILIRTLQIDLSGKVELFVGASLVSDSVSSNEYEELKAKSRGILNSLKNIDFSINTKNLATNPPDFGISIIKGDKNIKQNSFTQDIYLDDEIQELLQNRNQYLSKLWFFKQSCRDVSLKHLSGKKVLVINNEDDFTNMLVHLLNILGYETVLKRFDELEMFQRNISTENISTNFDFYCIGPGPGNPLDNSTKTLKNLEIIKFLEENNKKYFGICFGHQLICRSLGIELQKKDFPTQGIQKEIDLFGQKQKVGFYNTFAGFYPLSQPSPIRVPRSPSREKGETQFSKKQNGEIFAIKGENFFSFQFHPESILTQNGLEILKNNLEELGI